MGVTNNKKSITTEPPPKRPNNAQMAFHWHQIFTLDSDDVEVQKMFSSNGSLQTNAMYHYGETL